MKTSSRAALALLLGSVALPAFAADLPSATRAPLAPAFEAPSPWMIRVRALVVAPQSSATVNINGGPDITGLKASTAVVPELDIAYFFTRNIAAELVLGVTPHDVKGTGALASLGKIGSTWLLPPTLMLQYHFTDFGAFKPYVGAGVNYTFTFNNKEAGPMTSFKVKSAAGVALQVGFDYMLDRLGPEPRRQEALASSGRHGGAGRNDAGDRESAARPVADRRGRDVPLLIWRQLLNAKEPACAGSFCVQHPCALRRR